MRSECRRRYVCAGHRCSNRGEGRCWGRGEGDQPEGGTGLVLWPQSMFGSLGAASGQGWLHGSRCLLACQIYPNMTGGLMGDPTPCSEGPSLFRLLSARSPLLLVNLLEPGPNLLHVPPSTPMRLLLLLNRGCTKIISLGLDSAFLRAASRPEAVRKSESPYPKQICFG